MICLPAALLHLTTQSSAMRAAEASALNLTTLLTPSPQSHLLLATPSMMSRPVNFGCLSIQQLTNSTNSPSPDCMIRSKPKN